MIYNLEQCDAEIIKVIDFDSSITSLNYGPFDNGHVLVGFANGTLLFFDYPFLNRLELLTISEGHALTSITYDPTNYIFIGTDNGELHSISCIERKMNYMYLVLGKDTYCTVTM